MRTQGGAQTRQSCFRVRIESPDRTVMPIVCANTSRQARAKAGRIFKGAVVASERLHPAARHLQYTSLALFRLAHDLMWWERWGPGAPVGSLVPADGASAPTSRRT